MKRSIIHSIYRPASAPAADLPFGARSVGHYRVAPGFRDTVAVKQFVQIFWGIRGSGALVIDGKERRLKPQQIAVYLPGMRHEVYAMKSEWEYCWWTMDGPLAAVTTTALGLAANVYDAGRPPLTLLGRLGRLLRSPSRVSERQASVLAYRLLLLAAEGRKAVLSDCRIAAAARMIHAEWHRSQLCVKQLADRLQMNRSILTRRFTAALGISPIAYLTRLRVQNALSLLKQTDKPVAEIAALCGYDDPNYFARLIRRHIRLSPSGFRNGDQPDASGRTVKSGNGAAPVLAFRRHGGK